MADSSHWSEGHQKMYTYTISIIILPLLVILFSLHSYFHSHPNQRYLPISLQQPHNKFTKEMQISRTFKQYSTVQYSTVQYSTVHHNCNSGAFIIIADGNGYSALLKLTRIVFSFHFYVRLITMIKCRKMQRWSITCLSSDNRHMMFLLNAREIG